MAKVVRRGTGPVRRSTDREEVITFDESGNQTSDPDEMYGGIRTTVDEEGRTTSISRLYSEKQMSRKAPEQPTKVYFD